MTPNQWTSQSLTLSCQQSHSRNLIGLHPHSPTTFFTSSQDQTVRLWDLRFRSSVKLIRNKCLSEDLSNPTSDNSSFVYVGSGRALYQFDLRCGDIFVEEKAGMGDDCHYDSINRITYSQKYQEVACCDDEGDIRSYDGATVKCLNRLEQEHANICNSVSYISSGQKLLRDRKLCVSGGFDSTLILWDMVEEQPIKKIPVLELLHKHGISTTNEEFPFIHCIDTHMSSVLLGVESGYVLCLPVNQLRKPKFVMQANLCRVSDCIVRSVGSRNLMLVAAAEGCFSLFDFEARVDSEPMFIQKYKTIEEPVKVQVMDNYILVVSNSPALSFYQIKG